MRKKAHQITAARIPQPSIGPAAIITAVAVAVAIAKQTNKQTNPGFESKEKKKK